MFYGIENSLQVKFSENNIFVPHSALVACTDAIKYASNKTLDVQKKIFLHFQHYPHYLELIFFVIELDVE